MVYNIRNLYLRRAACVAGFVVCFPIYAVLFALGGILELCKDAASCWRRR